MKKKILFGVISTFMIISSGCSNKTFDRSMEEGKIALAEHDFTKAQSMFELAVSEHSTDEAQTLLEQTTNLNEIIRLYDKEEFDKSIDLCNELLKQDIKFNMIKNEINNIKDNIIKIKGTENEINKCIDILYKTTGDSKEDTQYIYSPDENYVTDESIKSKYYIFQILRNPGEEHETMDDSNLLVDKENFEVYEYTLPNQLYKFGGNKVEENNTQSKQKQEINIDSSKYGINNKVSNNIKEFKSLVKNALANYLEIEDQCAESSYEIKDTFEEFMINYNITRKALWNGIYDESELKELSDDNRYYFDCYDRLNNKFTNALNYAESFVINNENGDMDTFSTNMDNFNKLRDEIYSIINSL